MGKCAETAHTGLQAIDFRPTSENRGRIDENEVIKVRSTHSEFEASSGEDWAFVPALSRDERLTSCTIDIDWNLAASQQTTTTPYIRCQVV